jgi:chitin disaccharide deacetylase
MTRNTKRLIVNGDDFGLSAGVNQGIATSHEQGILTSASLMVRYPAAEAAASYARSHPALSVGLHVDLAEWTFKDESWQPLYQVAALDDPSAVAEELEKQLRRFTELVGREPTHLDSHQHVHESEPVLSLCLEAARQRKIVLRNVGRSVCYCGDFYGQSNKGYPYPEGVSVSALLNIIKSMREGITELGCHPAQTADMQGMYRDERVIECATLCHPEVREAIESEQILLCSFSNWAA